MDNVTERIMYPVKLERVTARIAPSPAPWEVLTAADAREMADDIRGAWMNDILGVSWMADAHKLTAYADAVDAMTQPARIEYTTEEA